MTARKKKPAAPTYEKLIAMLDEMVLSAYDEGIVNGWSAEAIRDAVILFIAARFKPAD